MNIPERLVHLTRSNPLLPRLLTTLLEEQSSCLLWLDEVRLLTASSESKTLDIWDTQTNQKTLTLELPQLGVQSLLMLPDGRGLLAHFEEKFVALLDLEWGSVLGSASPHTFNEIPEPKKQGASKRERNPSSPKQKSFTKALVSADSRCAYFLCDRTDSSSFYAWLIGEEALSWSWPRLVQPAVDMSLYKNTLTLFGEQRITQINVYTRQVINEQSAPKLGPRERITNGIALNESIVAFASVSDEEGKEERSVTLYDASLNHILWRNNPEDLPLAADIEPFLFERGEHLFYCLSHRIKDSKKPHTFHEALCIDAALKRDGTLSDEALQWKDSLRSASLSPNQGRLALLTLEGEILVFGW